jgi:hypothetical protein
MLADRIYYADSAERAGKYVKDNQGATQVILKYIQEKRLLTS